MIFGCQKTFIRRTHAKKPKHDLTRVPFLFSVIQLANQPCICQVITSTSGYFVNVHGTLKLEIGNWKLEIGNLAFMLLYCFR